MGGDWAELTGLWWKLEQSTGFVTKPKAHPTTHCPKQIGIWVKNARVGVPELSVDTFSAQWWDWWRVLNPEWRKRDGALVKEGEGSWDVLRCPGQNGFLNILICLKWWHAALDEETEDWKAAIADVKWVLKGMVR
ncbi:hypothetical protein FB451DRAFT_1042746 [Mycena latifolia]|nr:hypothetical protein FB451DRAFT_1042746 [Mycena latifolia]